MLFNKNTDKNRDVFALFYTIEIDIDILKGRAITDFCKNHIDYYRLCERGVEVSNITYLC
jgi:hypothetical protein